MQASAPVRSTAAPSGPDALAEPMTGQHCRPSPCLYEFGNGEKSAGLPCENIFESNERFLSAAPVTIVLKPVRRHRRSDAIHGDLSSRMRAVSLDKLRDVLGGTVQARPDE